MKLQLFNVRESSMRARLFGWFRRERGFTVYLQRTVVRWRQCSSIVQNTRLLLLSVLQPVITYRELKWKSVTKNVTPHSALFVQCFWSLMVFLWFVVLSIPHLFRPTCRPISNQQMYMSSASSDVQLGYLVRSPLCPKGNVCADRHICETISYILVVVVVKYILNVIYCV